MLQADVIEIDVVVVEHAIAVNLRGAPVDRLGHPLGRRAAIADIELDAEIAVRSARIVAGRQDQATLGAMATDHGAGRRCGEDAGAADQHAGDAVGRRHAQGAEPVLQPGPCRFGIGHGFLRREGF